MSMGKQTSVLTGLFVISVMIGQTQLHSLEKRDSPGKPQLTASVSPVLYDTAVTLTCLYEGTGTSSVKIYKKNREGVNVDVATVTDSAPAALAADLGQPQASVTSQLTDSSAQLSVTWPYNAIGVTTWFYCNVRVKAGTQPKDTPLKLPYQVLKPRVLTKPTLDSTPDRLVRGQTSKLDLQCHVNLTYVTAYEKVEVATCPDGWSLYQPEDDVALCYLPQSEAGEVDFAAAESSCQQIQDGAYLARPKTQQQADFVGKFFSDTWLGVTARNPEGDWKWQDGEDLNFNLWGPGQPDKGGVGQTDEGPQKREDPYEQAGGVFVRTYVEFLRALTSLPYLSTRLFSFVLLPFPQFDYRGNSQGGSEGNPGENSASDVEEPNTNPQKDFEDGAYGNAPVQKKCAVSVGDHWETRSCGSAANFVCEMPATVSTEVHPINPVISDLSLNEVVISQRTSSADPQTFEVLGKASGDDVNHPIPGPALSAPNTMAVDLSDDKMTLNVHVLFREIPDMPEYYYTCKITVVVQPKGNLATLQKAAYVRVSNPSG